MNKKILLSLMVIGLLITGCGKEEISEEPIINEMITTPVDPLQTVLSGDNIRLLGELEDALEVNLEIIEENDINYQEIEYKIPENTQIVNVYKIEVKDINEMPISFSKKVEVTITSDIELEQNYQLFKIGNGFTPKELDCEIENNLIKFEEKEFGFFVLLKEADKEPEIEETTQDPDINTEELIDEEQSVIENIDEDITRNVNEDNITDINEANDTDDNSNLEDDSLDENIDETSESEETIEIDPSEDVEWQNLGE